MKPIKNFFKLFLKAFAWIFVVAVISLIIIRFLENPIVISDFWQELITCAIFILVVCFVVVYRA